jgi:hypothetical protein
MSLPFYDHSGTAIAYTDDGKSIYTFGGEPVAYLDHESVYAYSGVHLGWFEKGLIRDHNGHVVFFTRSSSGGPPKPVQKVMPVTGVRGIRPIKGIRQIRPIKAIRSPYWSSFSGEAFFQR